MRSALKVSATLAAIIVSKTSALQDALKACGAVLARTGHHAVYRLPNGQTFVCSITPSDWRAERNMLRDLKRALAIPPRT